MAVVGVVVLLIAFSSSQIAKNKKQAVDTGPTISRVNLISAKDFQKNRAFVSANGIVESLEQADLRSQVNAPVQKINVSIGSKVRQGDVLVTLQNADFSAQLAQANAGVKAAQARLDEMIRGARGEDLKIAQARVSNAEQALSDTESQQTTSLSNALSAMLNSGLTATALYSNASANAMLVSGTYTGTAQGVYKITIFTNGYGYAFSYSGIESGTQQISQGTPIALGTKGLFLTFNDLSLIGSNNTWNISIPNTQASTYLQNYNTYQSLLVSSKTTITNAKNALQDAKNALDLVLAGASNEQIRAQQAAVEQAQAAVANLAAQYAKTVIRSPIDGTVSTVAVKYGDLVTAGQAVVSIVNKSGLQVKAYISSDDLVDIAEGAAVTVNETVKATLNRVSPSINSITKTVEVSILINDSASSGLTVGQNVTANITTKNPEGTQGIAYLLPFQAVKIISDTNAVVYTVSANSTIEEHPVVIGKVVGEQVEIKSGLISDMNIVDSVYDLVAGQQVVAQ